MYLKRAKLDLLETNRNPDDVINKEFCIGIGGKDYNIVCEDESEVECDKCYCVEDCKFYRNSIGTSLCTLIKAKLDDGLYH